MNRTALSPLLSTQFGLICTDQIGALEVTRRQFDLLVERRELLRVHPDVYRHAGFPITDDQRGLAAVLASGPLAALSHRSAAIRIGVGRVSSSIVEVSRPDVSMIRLQGAFVHRIPDLLPCDIEPKGGIPTTTPARTLLDLGVVTSPAFVARTLEEWAVAGIVNVVDLERIIERVSRQGRTGIGALRRALEDHARGAEQADSIPEGRMLSIIQRYGLPTPELHYLVTTSSGSTYELDWAYSPVRLAIEVDGFGVHLRSRQAFADDRIRQNELEIDGWQVLRFAAATVNFRPDLVARHLGAALARCDSLTAQPAAAVL